MRSDLSGDVRVLYIDPEGPPILTSADASDLIGNAWSEEATVIAVPADRLHPDFFRLSSGVAGEIAQKIVNYRLTLAVIGDVTEWSEASDAFRDWVWESNRGQHIWFLPDEAALDAKLTPRS